jgi:hypothetical protein
LFWSKWPGGIAGSEAEISLSALVQAVGSWNWNHDSVLAYLLIFTHWPFTESHHAHAAFLLASGKVRATTGQSKLKRVTANSKMASAAWRKSAFGEHRAGKSSYPVSIRSSALTGVSVIHTTNQPAMVEMTQPPKSA